MFILLYFICFTCDICGKFCKKSKSGFFGGFPICIFSLIFVCYSVSYRGLIFSETFFFLDFFMITQCFLYKFRIYSTRYRSTKYFSYNCRIYTIFRTGYFLYFRIFYFARVLYGSAVFGRNNFTVIRFLYF